MLDIYKAITSDEVAFPEGQPISGDLRDLLVGMFDKDPGTRISLAGVMQVGPRALQGAGCTISIAAGGSRSWAYVHKSQHCSIV